MNKTMKAEILASCADDYCCLAFIIGIIHDYVDLSQNKQKQVLDIISKLLKEDLIMAGYLVKGGNFGSWRSSNNEILKRIKDEWDKLEEPPSLNDVCWFNITSKGKEVLKELLKTVKFKDEE
jgi:hypothetical protein